RHQLAIAENTDWDGICVPTGEFENGHKAANAVRLWIRNVTAGVPPDWERGAALFQPLVARMNS
ncbi:MAG: hypothetical protein ABI680_16460, partial [Chthoniobacteraceae bacterium]